MIEYIGKCLLIKDKEKKTLAIGDLHIGYEASLNATGVFVARTLFDIMMAELETVFSKVGNVDEVVLLGDLKHTFGNILRDEWKDTDSLMTFLRERTGKIIAIKGNHDVLTDILGKRLDFEVVDYYVSGENIFIHGDQDFPEIWEKSIKTVILGHLHPAITISDSVKQEKYKCFLIGKFKGKMFYIVPSFISANEGSDPRYFETELPWDINLDKFKVIVVGEQLDVLDFGELKTIR